jgi:hypothetical protein
MLHSLQYDYIDCTHIKHERSISICYKRARTLGPTKDNQVNYFRSDQKKKGEEFNSNKQNTDKITIYFVSIAITSGP